MYVKGVAMNFTRKVLSVKIIFFLVLCISFTAFSLPKRVVAYCRLNRDVSEKLNFDMITDLNCVKIAPYSDGSLNDGDVVYDEFEKLITKAKAKNVNVFIMIAGSECNQMASSAATRATFAANITQFCLDNGIQGVDMDWEQPNGFNSTDRANYTSLLKDLDEALNPHDLLLTMAGGTWSYEINREGRQYLDWLNIMAYDMGKPDHSTFDDALDAILWWRKYGFELDELTLGLPFYGTNSSGTQRGYSDLVDNVGIDGPDDDETGGFHFNGVTTIKKKVQLAIDSMCLGVMIWEVSLDKLNESTSLLTAIYQALGVSSTMPDIMNPQFDKRKYTVDLGSLDENAVLFDLKGRTVMGLGLKKGNVARGQFIIKDNQEKKKLLKK